LFSTERDSLQREFQALVTESAVLSRELESLRTQVSNTVVSVAHFVEKYTQDHGPEVAQLKTQLTAV
jgi:regulator of replication initiation timing